MFSRYMCGQCCKTALFPQSVPTQKNTSHLILLSTLKAEFPRLWGMPNITSDIVLVRVSFAAFFPVIFPSQMGGGGRGGTRSQG